MYALVQRAASSARRAANVARQEATGVRKPRSVTMGPMRLNKVTVRYRYEESTYQAVLKLEGKAALRQKLEDPAFRKQYILNPELPEGRDIWKDNPRLDIRLPNDPLPYTWPQGKDFTEYDPVLKRNWEDDMFEKKWFGNTKGQVQGGDWANNRVSKDVPPRIKIYYANIVDNYQQGLLIAATKAFNALLDDFLAPKGSIPYGVYHTMLLIYKKRERFDRAFDMLQEILAWHTPTPDDYALGIEVLLRLHEPEMALDIWNSFQLRPSLSVNAPMYSQLLRTYAMMGDIDNLQNSFKYAMDATKSRSDLPSLPILATMIDICADLGYQEQLKTLVGDYSSSIPINALIDALNALNTAHLHQDTIKCFEQWFSGIANAPVQALNAVVRAYAELSDVKGLESILARFSSESSLQPDMSTYAPLIEHRFKLHSSSVVQQFAQDGLALKNVRPSVRNYRAMLTANVIAHVSSDFAVAVNALEDMHSKEIDVDAAFLEATTLAHQRAGKLNEIVDIWYENVVTQKLIPTRTAFMHLFTLAGIEQSLVNVALAWRLSQEMRLKPDFRFTSALSLALQPDRNYFGLVDTRRAHQHWTSQPHSRQVLNREELKDFTKFIEHVISTFTEPDKKALETAWAEMRETVHAPPIIEAQEVEIEQPKQPMTAQTESVKRIFAPSVIPEPGVQHDGDIARNVGIFATAPEVVAAAEDDAPSVYDISDAELSSESKKDD